MLKIFTNVQVMFAVQLLVPSGGRWKSSMDVTVVVELASRIQDLVQNESGELLAHDCSENSLSCHISI